MNAPPRRSLTRITGTQRLVAAVSFAGAAAALASAVVGGLGRMGVPVGPHTAPLVREHGPLMVGAFFGTVIALERAVALRRLWAFAAPVASLAAGIALVAAPASPAGPALLAVAGVALVAVFGTLLRARYEPFTLAMSIGAVAWAGGNILLAAGSPISNVVPWWAAFLALTIAGERLELSRFRQAVVGRSNTTFFWASFAAGAAALVISTIAFDAGVRLLGAAMVVLAGWLARHDVARATIRIPGPSRYMAAALFAGYAWLAIGGALAIFFGGQHAGLYYDAMWHAVFVGFVFSMVFAHAQVIIPALTGVRLQHGLRFYLPLAVLHGATALRVAGDLSAHGALRRAGGIGDALALLLFALVAVSSVRRRR